jgi:5-formyltetrahydrofolate cyclo-ligase
MIKDEQRRELRQLLASMPKQDRQEASQAICSHLSSLPSISTSDTILAYLPLAEEVDLTSLLTTWIEESRTICVPIVTWESKTMHAGLLPTLEGESLIESKYGLKEPRDPQSVTADSIDVMLVPGLGFDREGGRLGRGGGYYDRYLEFSRSPIVIGVAFDCQMLDSIDRQEHDQLMTAVVTPSGIIVH